MIDLANDEHVVTATLVGEAAGEGKLGEEDVAVIIGNRVGIARARPHKLFGNGSFASCCLVDWQFSCWKPAPIGTRAALLSIDFDNPSSAVLVGRDVARRLIAGALEDPTGGALTDPANPATHYKRTDWPWPKDWGPVVPPLWTYKHHHFFHIP